MFCLFIYTTVQVPSLAGTRPTGKCVSQDCHSSPSLHSWCQWRALVEVWLCPEAPAPKTHIIRKTLHIWTTLKHYTGWPSVVSHWNNNKVWISILNGNAICIPWPRIPVLYISCSEAIVCDGHMSSTSSLWWRWQESPLHTPTPESTGNSITQSFRHDF